MLIIFLFAFEFGFKRCWRVCFYLKEDASVSDLHERQQQVTVRLTDKDLKQLEFCSQRI